MVRLCWLWGVSLVACASARPVEVPPASPSEPATSAAEQVAVAVSSAPATDEDALLAAWREYRSCLVSRDGKRALAVVTQESIDEYGRQLTLALKATRDEVRELDLLDRYTVLMLRARVSPERLRNLDGRSTLALAIDRGWVGSELPREVVVKRIAGDMGYVSFVKEGEEIPIQIPFMRRVDGTWRVDLVELVRFIRPAFSKVLQDLAKQENTDVNGAILVVLERLVGEKPKDSIWDPPR
jgi:hypothetical protein